jgi:hypothetical protein
MTTDLDNRTRETSAPLFEARGWMRFLGVLCILQGAWMAATFYGLIVAWLPVWTGILLFQAAGAAGRAHLNADQESLIRSLRKLKTCLVIIGAVILLLTLAGAVFAIAFITGGLAGGRWLAN